jgi:thiol-disulfide isomerase/thioredoxin
MSGNPKRLKSPKDYESELAAKLKGKDRVFVLFYATWCGYSRMFLPIFEERVEKKGYDCLRVTMDEMEGLFEKYSVDVMPSVLVFRKGKLYKRLDGLPHLGLDEDQLERLMEFCK